MADACTDYRWHEIRNGKVSGGVPRRDAGQVGAELHQRAGAKCVDESGRLAGAEYSARRLVIRPSSLHSENRDYAGQLKCANTRRIPSANSASGTIQLTTMY